MYYVWRGSVCSQWNSETSKHKAIVHSANYTYNGHTVNLTHSSALSSSFEHTHTHTPIHPHTCACLWEYTNSKPDWV